MIKSGTDFRQFSHISVRFGGESEAPVVESTLIDVTSKYAEDEDLKLELDKFTSTLLTMLLFNEHYLIAVYFNLGIIGEKLNDVLGVFSAPLDGRFSTVRTSESNLGNFICDIMVRSNGSLSFLYHALTPLIKKVAATDSDLAILNSGTLRSDRIHQPGPFTLRDLNNILPMLDPLVVLEVTGSLIVLGQRVFSSYLKYV